MEPPPTDKRIAQTLEWASANLDEPISIAEAARQAGLSPVRMSHQALADATGLSRSAVQTALANLTRRSLVDSRRSTPTAVPQHIVHRPWIRRARRPAIDGA